MFDPLEKARALAKAGELDKAWKMTEQYLTDVPSCPNGLICAVYILNKAGRNVAAYQFAKRLVEVKPTASSSWTNLGTVCDDLWLLEESEKCHKKASEISVTTTDKAFALNNLSALYINTGRWELGEKTCLEALEFNPDDKLSKSNLGICQLARHQWREGMLNFANAIGTPQRRWWQFKDEPMWDGSPVKNLIVYGEQGLGDELMFASLIPDATKQTRVTIECDKRLAPLFKRSFPQCSVYGTRWEKEIDWAEEDRSPDASCPTGHLAAFLRATDADFPGTPYLVPDPDRSFMWKSLFASKGKPVIGLAWTGGAPHTGAKFRRLNLKDFMPVFKSIDAYWVSLEYKDRSREIKSWNDANPEHQVHAYPYATKADDYDETAALISGLDAFAGIHTTALHCAGGLGIPAFALISKISQWRYAEGEMPWYKSVKLFRQRGDYWPMRELAQALNLVIHDKHRRVEGRDLKVA